MRRAAGSAIIEATVRMDPAPGVSAWRQMLVGWPEWSLRCAFIRSTVSELKSARINS